MQFASGEHAHAHSSVRASSKASSNFCDNEEATNAGVIDGEDGEIASSEDQDGHHTSSQALVSLATPMRSKPSTRFKSSAVAKEEEDII